MNIQTNNLTQIHLVYQFDNGYGANVVRNSLSYGNKFGQYELAVLKNDKICYDTPITDNVIGFLSMAEVEEYLEKIAAL